MAENRADRVLPRDIISKIYVSAGLGDVLRRQREVAHLSGERVEDPTLKLGDTKGTETKQSEPKQRLGALPLHRTGVPYMPEGRAIGGTDEGF